MSLPVQHAADAVRKARLAQEARVEGNGVVFIVMEYIAGKTLDAAIPRDGLGVDEALRYATQIASALTAW